MTDAQKRIVAVGLALLIASTAIVPYRVTSHKEISRLLGRRGESTTETIYAPLWSAPGYAAVGTASPDDFDGATLDAGKAALIWAGIVVLTIAGIALASPTQNPLRPVTLVPGLQARIACWKCNEDYPLGMSKCPHCGAKARI